MTARRAGPRALAALAAAAVLAAALGYALRGTASSPDHFRTAAAVLAAVSAGICGLAARPAWPLSIGLALAAFSGHWKTMGIPVPLDRVLVVAGIGSVLLRETLTHSGRLRTRPIHWLLAVTLLYALCSALIAGSLSDSHSRFVLIDRFGVLPFALFFVAPLAFRTPGDRRVLIGVLVVLGGYLGITALLETTGPKSLIFPRYITDPSVGIHYGRARGPFVEASGMGLGLFACGVASVLGIIQWRDRRARSAAAAVLLLCALGTLFTLTRAVWLSTGIGVLVALCWPRQTRRVLVPVAALGAGVVLIAFAAIPGLQAHAAARSNDNRPLWDRYNSNAAALRMFEARPLVGFGWGAFRTRSGDFYRQSKNYPLTVILDVHNVFLANAAELGGLGAGLWLFGLLWAVGGGLGFGTGERGPPDLLLWRYGLLAIAVSYAIVAFSTPLNFSLPTYMLWTWAGICWAARPRRGPARPSLA